MKTLSQTPSNLQEFSRLGYEELFALFQSHQQALQAKEHELVQLKNHVISLEETILKINGQLVILRNKLYGKKSERTKALPEVTKPKPDPRPRSKREKSQLSEKYDLPIQVQDVELQTLPTCSCCQARMQDSCMTEDAEFLHVVPAEFRIILQRRHKYRCGTCHGQVITAPAPKRILPGSSYSDEMIQDVALSKYCDLIPVERYTSIAGRLGVQGLPPNSLIGLTHKLADFVLGAYEGIRTEALDSLVLHADETPHRMLEGDKKSHWFLWGFSTEKSSYYEIHDSRSGDVASDFLIKSHCQYLMSDVFSGYAKAVRTTNEYRARVLAPPIQNIYCNAHSRRKFKEARDNFPEEADFFLQAYQKIYELEDRGAMAPIFEDMRQRAQSLLESYSSKSSLVTALNYFLKNYEGLTRFLGHTDLPIDNNHQERLLRNAVIGRKTWYGTHSKRGARTAAILFSVVESCKLNGVNPRQYFKDFVQARHQGLSPFTPREYALRTASTSKL